MTRYASTLTRALPLATLIALATTAAHAAGPGNPSVFYCDQKTMADRQAEIFTIRQDVLPSLQEVIDDPNGGDDRVSAAEDHAEYSARLKELLLGVSSCKELRDFERYGEAGPPKKPPAASEPDDLLVAPPPIKPIKKPKKSKAPPAGADETDPAIITDFLEVSAEIMDKEVARMKAEGASQELIDDFVEASYETAIAEAARMRAVLKTPPSAQVGSTAPQGQ